MKKLLFLILTLLLLVGVASVAAVPVTGLTALAAYFPQDSVVYAGMRSDEDFVATLNDLVEQIGTAVPELGGISVSESLDLLAAGIKEGATFQELFRPWLGDTLAAGLLPLTSTDQFGNPVAQIAVSITDREAAEAFFLSLTDPRDYRQAPGDDFTAYEHINGNSHIVFRADVLLISSDFATIEAGGTVDAPLNADADFTGTLARLPESDYNAVIYVDAPAIYNFAMDSGLSVGANDPIVVEMIDSMAEIALGFTILGGNSLTIDVVTATDTAAMGLPESPFAPLDLSLAERIPAGTPLVILGTNIADSVDYLYAMLAQLSESQGMNFNDEPSEVMTAFWIVEFIARGFTGMNLQSEILPALNGTYALYAGANPRVESVTSATDVSPDELLDFALMLQVTDAAAATRLRENLSATLHGLPEQRQDNVNISFEDMGGVEVIRIGLETQRGGHEVELLLAVSDEVFVFGSRRYVAAALTPDVGLDQDAQWQEALQYVVPNAYALLYQSSDNLAPLGDLFLSTPGRDFSQIGMGMTILTNLVSSSSISYGRTADGGGQIRAVLTVNGG